MTRLKLILLAGTILPALALVPFVPASAQAPDRNERPRGQHPDGGGPRGGGGEHKGGGPRADNTEHRPAAGGRHDAQNTPEAKPNRGSGGGQMHREGEPGAGRKVGGDADRPGRGGNGRRQDNAGGRDNAGGGDNAGGRNNAGHDNNNGTPRRAGNEDGHNNGPGAKPNGRDGQPKRAQNPEDRRMGGNGNQPGHDGNGRRQDNAGGRENAGGRDNNPGGRENGGRDNAGRNDNGAPRRVGDGDRRDNPNARPNGTAGDRDRRDERFRDRNDNAGRNDDANSPRRAGNDRPGGFGGGFLAPTNARRLDDVRRDRREVREGGRVFIREPGRTIIQENGRAFIVHDENDRFRALGLNVRRERRGNEVVDIINRPGGEQILTFTDGDGRMLRRVRRGRDGREVILIDNGVDGRVRSYEEDVVVLPPPPMRIPRDRYVVDYRGANAGALYDTLIAPPLAAPPQRYTLDQIRYSPDVRNYVRSIDINTINFDSGSWEVPAAASGQLEALGTAIKRAVDRNPNSVFLVEGFTDATGNPDDNLSLSDRRAQSVAEILTKDFNVPPENLTTQGYGQQNPKDPSVGPSAANRRVVVQNITQLLASGGEPPAGH